MKWLVAVCMAMTACGVAPGLPDASGNGGGGEKDAGVVTKPDAATILEDAGTNEEDAGAPDAGQPDAGQPDAGGPETSCSDGIDDDQDGLIDCLDPDCAARTCRGSAGDCDLAESCSNGACPADAFVSPATTCRASAGGCDMPEACTGAAAACPADLMKSGGVECRASAGECDTAETCTGVTATCPVDALLPATYVCRTPTGPCDVAETCLGTKVTCPPDGWAQAGFECRPAAGDCDVAETCSGVSDACPVNQFIPASMSCRASVGSCDIEESCTGSSPSCPNNLFRPSGYICGPSVGGCDIVEVCNGATAACPPNVYQSPGFVCSAASCVSNMWKPEVSCNGTAQCDVANETSCGAYVCMNANQCFTSCGSDAACAVGQYCSADPFGGGGNNCLPKRADGTSCFKVSQCSSGACTQFWRDADNDTFTTTAASFCGTTPPGGFRSAAKGLDCDDTAPSVFPGQTAFFATPRAGGGFDYDCDGIQTQQFPTTGFCSQFGCSNPGKVWTGTSVPQCGALGNLLQSCTANPFCSYMAAVTAQGCR